MIARTHRFVVEIRGQEGRVAGRFRVTADRFQAAAEWLRFRAIRHGLLPPILSTALAARVAPEWDREEGEPLLSGFRVALLDGARDPERALLATVTPAGVLSLFASQSARTLVTEGRLAGGESFRFRVLGYPCADPAAPPEPGPHPLTLEPIAQPLPAGDRPRAGFEERGSARGAIDEDAMRVYIPRTVLDEAEAMKHAAREVETGGILIGHLHRDPSLPDVFLEITAQIPLEHAEAERYRLGLTARTWTAAQAAIDLRGRRELIVGWFHTHPARHWRCRECEPSRRLSCPLAQEFFSEIDLGLHTTLFTHAPYAVALVASDRPLANGEWEDAMALYGWERGLVRPRSFHVLEALPADAPA